MRRADGSRSRGPFAVLFLSHALLGAACGPDAEAAVGDVGPDAPVLDATTEVAASDTTAVDTLSVDTAPDVDTTTPGDATPDAIPDAPDTTPVADTPPDVGPPPAMPEEEPNNGAALTEYNALALGTTATGAIGAAKDADVFRVPTQPGQVYRAVLTASPSSDLSPHLTVMDAGRGNDAAGEDYVKMAVGAASPAVVEWLAMGAGEHFVIVRDARNLAGGSVGSAAHTYELVVTERALADVSGPPLVFPATVADALPSAGGLRLFAFDGTEGRDLRADLRASGDMDARLLVFATATGDWIARNDDRSANDVDPLLDAPLTESGAMWLVVENIAPSATTFGFTLSCQFP